MHWPPSYIGLGPNSALQMKSWWESNINFWFPFMYSQKWNCDASSFPNRIIMFCLPFLHSFICERFIFFQDRSVYFAAAKYVDRSWEYINCSQTHECRNWDWGCPISLPGIHKLYYRYSVCTWSPNNFGDLIPYLTCGLVSLTSHRFLSCAQISSKIKNPKS